MFLEVGSIPRSSCLQSRLDWLASKVQDLPVSSPQLWNYVGAHPAILMWVLGIILRSSLTTRQAKHFTSWAHFTARDGHPAVGVQSQHKTFLTSVKA